MRDTISFNSNQGPSSRNMSSNEYDIELKTDLTVCPCGGDIKNKNRGAYLTLYTSDGTKTGFHQEHRCKSCGRGFYHGFDKEGHAFEYHANVLENQFIVISQNTGFELKYLYHCCLLQYF